MSSSTSSKKTMVRVKFHYPFACTEEHANVKDTGLVGNHQDILYIKMPGHIVRYPIENIFMYETIEVD